MAVKRGPDGQISDTDDTSGRTRAGGRSYEEPTLKRGAKSRTAAAEPDDDRTWRPGQTISPTASHDDDYDYDDEDPDAPPVRVSAVMPVGWLVIIEGPGAGAVLTLQTGHNIVGRGHASHLVVDFGDRGVSHSQFNVLYEPRAQQFHIERMPGAAETYLEDDPLRALVELTRGARIRVSETVMRFMPFCDSGFSWPHPGAPK